MKILITGGNGMVGSCLKQYLPMAYTPNSEELNLQNARNVEDYLQANKFDYVIHLAAVVGSLHDNIENQIKYFDDNILMNTIITKYSYESGVKNFLGILSTCIYPDIVNDYPMREIHLHSGKPHKDLMSYAYAKRSHAVQIDAYKQTHSVNYNYLIPSNMYGIISEKHKARTHFLNDLIFKIINAEKSHQDFIELFGDGTPLRQFMYAEDFAKIIYKYVNENVNDSFNVAPEENLTIDSFAKIAFKACEVEFGIKYNDSKPNGQFRKDVSTNKFKSYFPDFKFTPLEEGIKEVYNYYVNV